MCSYLYFVLFAICSKAIGQKTWYKNKNELPRLVNLYLENMKMRHKKILYNSFQVRVVKYKILF